MAEPVKPTKKIKYKQQLPLFFACVIILLMGTLSILTSGSLDYYTVLGTLLKIIPAAAIMFLLGWIMGVLLDKKSKRKVFRNLGLGEINIDDLLTKSAGEETNISAEDDDDIDKKETSFL